MDAKKIGKKLMELRGDKAREQVALDLGISYPSLVNYELGVRVPRDEIKLRICEYYNVDITELFFM